MAACWSWRSPRSFRAEIPAWGWAPPETWVCAPCPVAVKRRYASVVVGSFAKRSAVVACAVLLVCAGLAGAAVKQRGRGKRHRAAQHVTICHHLGNGGYNRISPSATGDVNGHAKHADDIIPPFIDYKTGELFPGLNWDATGQAIWYNGCGLPPPPPGQIYVGIGSCVQAAGGATYSVTFDYNSGSTTTVTIPAGPDNSVSPRGPNRGQPTSFAPGSHLDVFTVTGVVGTTTTWTVRHGGYTSSAEVTGTNVDCSPPPTPPIAPIGIFVKCVTNHGATFDATFGYQNDGTTTTIPVGPENFFSPAPQNRQQTTVFAPGNVQTAFTVTGIPTAHNLVWTLTSDETRTTTASASFESKCPGSEVPPPIARIGIFVTCVANHGATYDAVFGYQSDNVIDQTVPIGEGNKFTPAPADRGQPAVFRPGRLAEAVTVTGIPATEHLVWTLASDGTRTATASASFASKCAGPEEPGEPPGTEPPGTEPPGPIPPDPPGPQPPVTPRPVGIFAACVVNHGGTYDATFGYVNENVGNVIVPIGPNNAVTPGPANQGQPETLRPGFEDAAFTVHRVSASTAVSWRVISGEEVRIATATAKFHNKCMSGAIDPIGDLGVAKSVSPRTAAVGQRVRFTIVVHNTGSAVLRPAKVVDSLPGNQLATVSVKTTRGSCRTTTVGKSRQIVCSAPTLAPGQSFTIRVTTRATSPGSATNRATIIGLHNDPTPADNAATATVDIRQPAPPPPRVTG